MKTVPEFLTRDQLAEVLHVMAEHVSAGDSWEGFIEYQLPWDREIGDPETDPDKEGFRVQARYRIGNLQGQGGMRMIGHLR